MISLNSLVKKFPTLQLLLGNGLAQVIQASATFLLSRIYLPSDFGFLGQIQSVATIGAILVTLQLHLAIPLCKSDLEAETVVEIIQTIALSQFIFLFPVALYFGELYIFAVALMLCVGLSNTYKSYLVYNGRFGKLSVFYVIRSMLIIIIQLGFAFLKIKSGLLWGMVFGEGLTALYLRFSLLGSPRRVVNFHKVKELVVRLNAFSLYGTVQEIVSVSAFYAPILLYTEKFDKNIGGQYAMATRLIWAPVILLTSSITQVLYHDFGKSLPRDRSSIKTMFPDIKVVIAILVVCVISFQFQDIFLLILGPKWQLASQFLPVVLVWGCIFIFSIPFRVICRVGQMQKFQFIIDLFMLISIICLFTFSKSSPIVIMWGLTIIALLQNSTLAFVVWNSMVKNKIRDNI